MRRRPDRKPSRWIEGPVCQTRIHIALCWPLRDGPRYLEYGEVALLGDVEGDPCTLHVELLPTPALAPHHRAQVHEQVRARLDEYVWEVNLEDFDLWPEAVHRCRSSGQWYSALPWVAIDPRPETARRREQERNRHAADRVARGLPPATTDEATPRPPIPTHCPACATPTVHDPNPRVFRCPACDWHD